MKYKILDMQEILGIEKSLLLIQGNPANNISKLTEIDKCIKKDSKKQEEVEDNPTYSEEQRQLYGDKLDDLKTEQQARLEITKPKKSLNACFKIKQTIEKVLDEDKPLAKQIRTFG